MSAYDHSFLPSGTGRYIKDMVRAGRPVEDAFAQAAIEHGSEQAQEVMRLLRVEMDGRDWGNRRSLVPALRRAIRRAEAIETQRAAAWAPPPIMSEPLLTCRECGLRWTPARVDERKEDGSFGPGPYIRCVECKATYWRPIGSKIQMRAYVSELEP